MPPDHSGRMDHPWLRGETRLLNEINSRLPNGLCESKAIMEDDRRLLATSPSKSSYATGASGLEGSATVGMLNQINALNGSQN